LGFIIGIYQLKYINDRELLVKPDTFNDSNVLLFSVVKPDTFNDDNKIVVVFNEA
jgi:hypothetical protein